jgi:hypothetical protein
MSDKIARDITHRAFELVGDDERYAAVVDLDGACIIEWDRVRELAAKPLTGHCAGIAIAKLLLHARAENTD